MVATACGGTAFTPADDGGSSDATTNEGSTSDGATDSGGTTGDGGNRVEGGGLGVEAGSCRADAGLFDNIIQGCTNTPSCSIVFHQTDCCGSKVAIGINHASRDAFTQDEAAWEASCPACGCAAAPTIAEDGKPCDVNTCLVTCDNNRCRTTGP